MNVSHERWKRGDCPCCGWMRMDEEWEWNGVVTTARAIGEGVMLCGRCVAHDHGMEMSGQFERAILEDIARPEGNAVDRLVESVRRR